jgi:hypothetical protein
MCGGEVDIASFRGGVLRRFESGATRDMSALVLVFAGEHGVDIVPIAGYLARVCWKHRTAIGGVPWRSILTFPAAALIRKASWRTLSCMAAIRFARWRRIGGVSKILSASLAPSAATCRWCRSQVTRTSARRRCVGALSGGRQTAPRNHPVLSSCSECEGRADAAGIASLRAAQHRPNRSARCLCMALGVAARPAPAFDVLAMIG